MASAAYVISASVVECPSVKRRLPAATSRGAPIASRTCDICIFDAAQADPVPTETPSRSSRMTKRRASISGNDTCSKLGRRSFAFFGPETTICGNSLTSSLCKRSRRRERRWASSFCRACTISSARAKPIIPATFSVPERTPPSWPPPSTSGRSRTLSDAHKRPTCLGP